MELEPEAHRISTGEIFKLVMRKDWRQIINCYQAHLFDPSIRITKDKDTVLHVAISSLKSKQDAQLIVEMIHGDSLHLLSLQNERGDTPLHLAAAAGWKNICEKIANKDKHLIEIRNNRGETPLFLAADHGKHEAFLSLHSAYFDETAAAGQHRFVSLVTRAEDGNTILHSTVALEYFRLAYWIIHKYETLSSRKNVEGNTPLQFLACKPNVFKSSSRLGPIDSIIYHCVRIEKMNPMDCFPKRRYTSNDLINCPPNCVNALLGLFKPLIKMCFPGSFAQKQTRFEEDEEIQVDVKEDWVEEEDSTAGWSWEMIKKIKDQKRKNIHAKQVMNSLINSTSAYDEYLYHGMNPSDQYYMWYSEIGHDVPDFDLKNYEKNEGGRSEILTAAENGIPEMVAEIYRKLPGSIHDTDNILGRNVILVAAANRQTGVLRMLLRQSNLPDDVFHHLDKELNGVLHLAAYLKNDFYPWQIPGAALQMQWELKWFKYVKNSVPANLSIAQKNMAGKTPIEIFTETHKNLVTEGAKWLLTTSESCSVVATLIAGVTFATSASVPGGTNDRTGYPIFQGETNFRVFSIASLMALCLSVTSLVCLLGIITSRFDESDFRTSSLMKLVLGMTCLFMSIGAMLVSFCAGQSFNLRDTMKASSLPVYIIVSVPLMIFLVAELPLYMDLLWAVSVRVPLRSYKFFFQNQ